MIQVRKVHAAILIAGLLVFATLMREVFIWIDVDTRWFGTATVVLLLLIAVVHGTRQVSEIPRENHWHHHSGCKILHATQIGAGEQMQLVTTGGVVDCTGSIRESSR